MRIGVMQSVSIGGRNEEHFLLSKAGNRFRQKLELLNSLQANTGDTVAITHSGRYYEMRADGWYETSDSDECDREHGLPPQGRKL